MSRNEASKELAAWFTEILGKEIKPETIRKKDLRARNEVGTNVPTGWDGGIEVQYVQCKKCSRQIQVSTITGKPFGNGICRRCKKGELEEQKLNKLRQEVAAATKKFETTPVDAESDKFWNDITDRILDVDTVEGDIPCGKVSEEVREKVECVEILLRKCIYRVLETSTTPTMST
jgi:hypothetical protein